MTFTFAPARRESVSLLIALAGASGSGKTFSALRLAKGISPAGKIAFVDTEARRGLHYADAFRFMHADMRSPFRPARFVEAIKAAEEAGAEVIIIDSFSHEYDGEGGLIDWADDLGKTVKSPGNWMEPKKAHKRMMNCLLQARATLIFCLRADEKIEITRGENGRTQVRPLGWMPICEKRFMYEMTASFTLTPDRPGRPQFALPHKLQEQHRRFFPEGEPIGEESGRLLAEWARGGVAPPEVLPAAIEAARLNLNEAAERGADVFRMAWQATPKPVRATFSADDTAAWKRTAEAADKDDAEEAARATAPADADDFPGDR